MNQWQQAFTLTTLKLKGSVKQFFLLTLLYLAIFITLSVSLSTYLANKSFVYDLFFISVFAGVASYSSSANSQFIMLQQLATKQATIVKSWIIFYLLKTLPFLIGLLIGFYTISSKLRSLMSPLIYICFSIVLLCLTTIFVDDIPTDRAKDIDRRITPSRIFILVASATVFIGLFIFIQLYSTYGIIHLLILLVNKQPIIIASLALVFTIAFIRYRYLAMRKQLEKTDYF